LLRDVGIAIARLSAASAEERYASPALVHLDAEAVELDLMKPAIPEGRLSPGRRSARRNEDWMQHSSGYTKRLKTTSVDL
jgi:hypothetical protein